jgi:hypothetical protein
LDLQKEEKGMNMKMIVAALLALALVPATGQATILFDYGLCNPSDGCDQSVNFSPANSGTTVVGNTNPPLPLYDVFAQSLDGATLHGSGSTVDTGVGGPGITSIQFWPEAGYAWGAFEFQLDSANGDQTVGTAGLTFTVFDGDGTPFVFLANFPWEGDNGENQHYHFHATNGEVIALVRIDYSDPLGQGNTINDIHNIDVNTRLVPEPSTVALLAIGLISLGWIRRKRG